MATDPELQNLTIQTKSLINAFEKGDLLSVVTTEDHVLNNARQLHPEMSMEELAEPGTAKKLHLLFESKAQISPNSCFSCRSPTSANVKLLTPEMFAGFEGRIISRQNTEITTCRETEKDEADSGESVCSNDQSCEKIHHNEKNKLVDENSELLEINTIQDCHGSTDKVLDSQVVEDAHGGCADKDKVLDNGSTHDEIQAASECLEKEPVIQDGDAGKKDLFTESTIINEKETEGLKEEHSSESETTITTTTTIVTSPITIIVTEDDSAGEIRVTTDVSSEHSELVKQSVDEQTTTVTSETVTSLEDMTHHADHVTAADDVIDQSARVACAQISDANPSQQKRNVLIVSVLKQDTSLHQALCECTVKALTDAAHDVIVTDVCWLMEHAPEDFSQERQKWMNADLIMFLYRMVLNTHPAALQEWLENVLTNSSSGDVTVGESPLKKKKGVLVVTTDVQKAAYDEETGSLGDIKTHLAPLQIGILHNASLDVLKPQIIFGVGASVEEEEKECILNAWSSRLLSIWDETPLSV